jgi:hypothetical protein
MSEQTDLREVLNAMNEHNVEAIAQALFGKPTGISRVDKAIREVAAMVDALPSNFSVCSTCQSRMGLTYCRICHEWFCMKPCLTDHGCAQIDGPTTDPLRG